MIHEKIRLFVPALCHLINDTGQGSIAALLPLFISLLDLSYYQVATVMLMASLCSSVVQPRFRAGLLGHISSQGAGKRVKRPF